VSKKTLRDALSLERHLSRKARLDSGTEKVAAASPLAEAQLPPRAQRALFCAAGILFLGGLREKRGGASTVLKLRASTQRLPSFSLLQ
jgi:hypothetical protein